MTFRQNMGPMAIVVAVDQYAGFGKDGKIPWNYPEDMKRFKEVTTGNVCVMGRKTYIDMLRMVQERKKAKGEDPDDITEILPGRQSFVVSNTEGFVAPGATVVSSLREAVQQLSDDDDRTVFVIGGRQLFIEALSWVDTVYMTIIFQDYKCDVNFPADYVIDHFEATETKKSDTDPIVFTTYKRKK